jgi:hypothetical protein
LLSLLLRHRLLLLNDGLLWSRLLLLGDRLLRSRLLLLLSLLLLLLLLLFGLLSFFLAVLPRRNSFADHSTRARACTRSERAADERPGRPADRHTGSGSRGSAAEAAGSRAGAFSRRALDLFACLLAFLHFVFVFIFRVGRCAGHGDADG